MTKVRIDPGICGLKTVVTAEADEDGGVIVKIDSQCPSITAMAKELGEEFDPYELCMQKPGNGPLYEYARTHAGHAACATISGIIKCVEAECRLALKKNAIIEFIE